MTVFRLGVGRTRLPFCNLYFSDGGPRLTLADGRRVLAATCVSTLSDAQLFLIDSQGPVDKVPLPEGHIGAYLLAPGPDGKLYLGACNGDLACFDPARRRIEVLLSGQLRSIIWGGAVAPNGRLIATDAQDGHAVAVVYDTLRRQMVCRYEPLAETSCYGHHWHRLSDGRFLAVVSSPQPRLVLWDPESLAIEVHTPAALADYPFVLATAVLPGDRLLAARPGGAGVVLAPPSFAIERRLTGALGPLGLVGNPLSLNGRLYASDGVAGGIWRLDDLGQWCRVHPGLPEDPLILGTLDGRSFTGVSVAGQWFHYDPTADRFTSGPLDNVGLMSLEALCPGPEGQVYAATFINNRFCRFDPRRATFQDLGRVAPYGGEVLAMTEFDGRLYMASYIYATLNVFDPSRPIGYPDNPRPIGALGHEQYRPRAMVADDRFLYVATHAMYGRLGGAVTVFDPRTEQWEVYRHVVRNQNVNSLVLDRGTGVLYGGTTAQPEGAPATEPAGAFFAWSTTARRKLYQEIPWPDAKAVKVLCLYEQHVLVGVSDRGEYFLWDVRAENFLRREPLPMEGDLLSGAVGPDGRLYVGGSHGLWRWNLARRKARRLVLGRASHLCVRDRTLYFLLDGRELAWLNL